MNIVGLEYSLTRRCLEIYLSGCLAPHCQGCHNFKLWDFNIGTDWNLWKDTIKEKTKSGLIDRLAIMGGEPLDQDRKSLNELIIFLKQLDKELWLFTRYTSFENIDVDYIKCGKYIAELPSKEYPEYNLILASNNQKVIKLLENDSKVLVWT